MIADTIVEFLKNPTGKDKKAIRLGLDIAQRAMENAMEKWSGSGGRLYASAISFACDRKAAYRYYEVEGEERNESFYLNVSLGSMVEAWVLAIGKAAGLQINPAPKLPFLIDESHQETVMPDALLKVGHKLWNVEIKKVSRYAYNEYIAYRNSQNTIHVKEEEDEPSIDSWGYQTQMALECYGWKQIGLQVEGSIFVFVRAENPVDVGEIVLGRDEELALKAIERANRVLKSEKPEDLEKGFSPVKETYRRKETGRLKLPFQCSYCDYKKHCYPEATLEFKSNRPVWVVS